MEIKEILQELRENKISVEEAEKEIKNNQFESIDDYAKIDHNRKERAGASEVVFCQGKKDEFLVNIYKSIYFKNREEQRKNRQYCYMHWWNCRYTCCRRGSRNSRVLWQLCGKNI